MNLFNYNFASFTLVEAYYIAGKPSPDSKSRVRVDIQLVNSVNDQTVFVENVLVDDGYTETLCIHRKIAEQLGLKRSRASHDLKLGDGRIIKEHKYIIGKKNRFCILPNQAGAERNMHSFKFWSGFEGEYQRA